MFPGSLRLSSLKPRSDQDLGHPGRRGEDRFVARTNCLPTVRQRDSRCEPFKLGDEAGEVGESGDLALQGCAGRSSLW